MNFFNAIAHALDAHQRCDEGGNWEWRAKHQERIEDWCKAHAPSGSGFDSGTKLDFDTSKPERLVFTTSFHHMNDGGYYDGWTEHTVIVKQSLLGFDIRVTGRDRNDIKDYIAETFRNLCSTDVERKLAA